MKQSYHTCQHVGSNDPQSRITTAQHASVRACPRCRVPHHGRQVAVAGLQEFRDRFCAGMSLKKALKRGLVRVELTSESDPNDRKLVGIWAN